MKIAFFVKTLNSDGGGAERVLAQVSRGLVERGHEVTIVSFDTAGSPDFYEFDPRISRVWLGAGRPGTRTGVVDAIKRVWALRRSIRKLGPDAAVGLMHSAFVPLALAAVGTKVPVIASEHTVYGHYRNFPLEALIVRATAPLYARIAIVSENVRQTFPKGLRHRMTVTENPVETTARHAESAKGLRQNTTLNVGRLVEWKNQATLISAFARIASRHPEWKLRIVGEGDLRAALEAQVQDLGLQERVELPGAKREIWREYASAQFFVLPSAYESLGLATAEALSMGLPAIGFADCPGTNELIRHEVNGLLVDHPDRVAGLADALDRLISSPADRERMGGNARTSVDHLSLANVVNDWERLFEMVTRPAGQSG